MNEHKSSTKRKSILPRVIGTIAMAAIAFSVGVFASPFFASNSDGERDVTMPLVIHVDEGGDLDSVPTDESTSTQIRENDREAGKESTSVEANLSMNGSYIALQDGSNAPGKGVGC